MNSDNVLDLEAAEGDSTAEDSTVEDEMPPKSPAFNAQKEAITNFEKNWITLQGVVRSINTIEPLLVDAELTAEQIQANAFENLEGL